MEQDAEELIETPGKALFYRRNGATEEGDPQQEAVEEGLPVTANPTGAEQASPPPPTLDGLARRLATMAEEAANNYLSWARQQAEAIVTAAREQSAATLDEANQSAASIIADTHAAARQMLQEADQRRAEADAETAEVIAKAQALLRQAELEAERTRQEVLLAATQEASAILEAKRAEAAAIISESRALAEAEAKSIRERAIGAAHLEALRLREEAILFSKETRGSARALADAVVQQLRSAAQALEQAVAGSTDVASASTADTVPIGGRSPEAQQASDGHGDDEPESAEMISADAPTRAHEDVAKVLLIVHPVRSFERLLALEGTIGAIGDVRGVEVVDIDGLTIRMSAIVHDLPSFASQVGQIAGAQSVTCDSPTMIRITLNDEQDGQR
jgi:cell division septum initiation protein DivIVA